MKIRKVSRHPTFTVCPKFAVRPKFVARPKFVVRPKFAAIILSAVALNLSSALPSIAGAPLDPKRFASQFEFVQPEDVGTTFIPAKKANLLNWNVETKQKVLKCAQAVETKLPGLLSNAAHGTPIRFFRASVLNEGDTIDGDAVAKPNPLRETAAATTPGAMTFSEKYFAQFESGRDVMFSHEIAHAADMGNRVAYSPAWVSFMNRNKIKSARVDSPYVEALAETVSDWFVGTSIPDKQTFEQKILPMLCEQSSETTAYLQNMTAGYVLFKSRKYSDADAKFEAASRNLPESADPHIRRVSTLYLARQNSEALAEADSACQKLDASEVSYAEPVLQQLLYLRALLQADTGDYREAVKTADKLLKVNANHKKAKMLKAFCQERLKS